jgi:hypothetical protein
MTSKKFRTGALKFAGFNFNFGDHFTLSLELCLDYGCRR